MTAIIGWAHSKFGKLEAETLESLIAGIAAQAIADAGIQPKDIDTIFVGNFGGFEKQSFPAAFALAGELGGPPLVALLAPSRYTARSRSGRSRSSAVGPEKRISPFSMK